jgi:hypothetical protein
MNLSLLSFVSLTSIFLSLANALNWYVGAQYRSPTCDPAKMTVFESFPQSACAFDGNSYSFWNCSSGNPVVYNCGGSDKTCQGPCMPTNQKFNSSDCVLYLAILYPDIYARRQCLEEPIPFPGLQIHIARKYFTPAGCAAKNASEIRSVVGTALRCANVSATASLGSSCSTSANGTVTLITDNCPSSTTCQACNQRYYTPVPAPCTIESVPTTTYPIAACWKDGNEGPDGSAPPATTTATTIASPTTAPTASPTSPGETTAATTFPASDALPQSSSSGSQAPSTPAPTSSASTRSLFAHFSALVLAFWCGAARF